MPGGAWAFNDLSPCQFLNLVLQALIVLTMISSGKRVGGYTVLLCGFIFITRPKMALRWPYIRWTHAHTRTRTHEDEDEDESEPEPQDDPRWPKMLETRFCTCSLTKS